MNSISQVLSDLFITPEKTFPTLETKAKAYLFLYILPLVILISLTASAIFYGYTFLVIATPICFGLLYLGYIYFSYRDYRQPHKLKIASEVVLPEILINYFKKQYPSASVPMMVSKDRSHWVAYGHIDKKRMARAMTFVEYHLMPHPPVLSDYFMKRAQNIKHQYLIIEDPQKEIFRITDNPSENTVYYPVTVFDKEVYNETT